MGEPIQIETGWPVEDLWPNARAHHMRLHSARKAAKKESYWSTCIVLPRGWKTGGGRFNLTIRAYPAVNRDRDNDNLIAAVKGHLDGIADALHVNDKLFNAPAVEWPGKDRRGKLVFIVEEVP